MNKDENVLSVNNLRKFYEVSAAKLFAPKRIVKAMNGISFDLKKGETLSVVGESGCGKSTLGRVLTMIEAPDAGTILFHGEDITNSSNPEVKKMRRQKIQIIFQNPYSSLNPRKKVGATLEEPLLLNTKLDKQERKEKVLEIMAKVGLREEFYNRYPHMFSGGQRQRIAIARGLMLQPDVLVADEPVSALDVSVRAQVLNLMLDLQKELGLSYVFISHDLSVVKHISHNIMVMYLGKCVEYATVDALFNNPRHPYTLSLLASTPSLTSQDKDLNQYIAKGELPSPLNPPPGCAFNTRCPRVTDTCRLQEPELKRYADGALIACHNIEI